VLDVTEGIPGNQWVWEARLRDGDASAGVLALSNEFFPRMQHSWLESLIEEARTHHGARLTQQLREVLRSRDIGDQQRHGALCLAGYLGDPELAADVKVAWENSSSHRNILLVALWAGFRCAGNTPAELLGPMMPHILTLQHDESGRTVDERGRLLESLSHASRHGFGEPVLSYLVELGAGRDEFWRVVASILDDVDHPVAIRYLVRLFAEEEHRAKQAGGSSLMAHIWSDRLKRKANDAHGRLSFGSLSALRSLWAEEQSPEWLQKYAFSIWACHVDDLTELAEVTPGSAHYESAVWYRALRCDRAVAGYVLGKLESNSHWFCLVPHVWGDEFEPAVDVALGRIAADSGAQANSWPSQNYLMSELLRDIPTKAAERLLVNRWASLSQSPRFVQAALYHGTATCLELASSSLVNAGQNLNPLEHIGSFFGFYTQGLMDRLTRRHLDVLLPYLEQLDDLCLGSILNFCRQFDHWAWAKRHLEPEMRRRVPLAKPDLDVGPPYIVRATRHRFPTDEDLLVELEDLEQTDSAYRPAYLSFWWDKFVERGDSDDRPRRLLFSWLARNQSLSKFVVAIELLRERGKRRDLEALLKFKPAGEDPEGTRAVADAEYAIKRRSLD
jgi:hypothetical protein